MEEIALSVAVSDGTRFPVNFIRNINWVSLKQFCNEWIKHPMNIALLIWFICVAVSSSMLGLLLLGILNKELPVESTRIRWIEINNQVLNALFTLMSLYEHPSLLHHLVLLCRWRSQDAVELREVYSKNGTHPPHERAHMMVVVILLHITCISQYILCGLYWGYTITNRPEFFENFFSAVGFAAPVLALAYAIYSPLGRERKQLSESKEENSAAEQQEFSSQSVAVTGRKWKGGIFECRDDIPVSSLSFLCCFCVFGWNMERLGLGNMYVHIAMFLLLCFAPLWIFGTSALHISNDVIRNVVAIAGMVLSVCGLLYGGLWRIQMRKKFKIQGNGWCCGSESATDYMLWLFCCSCSLAQEVRTGNLYEVEDGSFYEKSLGGEEESNLLPCTLPSESRESVGSELERASSWKKEKAVVIEMVERECGVEKGSVDSDDIMKAPFQHLIELGYVRGEASPSFSHGLQEHIAGTWALDVVNSFELQVVLAGITWFLIGMAILSVLGFLGEGVISRK